MSGSSLKKLQYVCCFGLNQISSHAFNVDLKKNDEIQGNLGVIHENWPAIDLLRMRLMVLTFWTVGRGSKSEQNRFNLSERMCRAPGVNCS